MIILRGLVFIFVQRSRVIVLMKKLISPIVLMFLCRVSAGQDSTYKPPGFREEKATDILIGYNIQGNWSDSTGRMNKYFEIGIGRGKYFYHRHGVTALVIYLSEEILLSKNKIYGTKIGCFAHWLFDAGFSIIYYTDFKKGNLKLRPELGVGMGRIRAIIGYNIPTISNKAMPELRRQNAQITIQAGLGIKKQQIKRITNQ